MASVWGHLVVYVLLNHHHSLGCYYPLHARSSCCLLFPTLCSRPLHICFPIWSEAMCTYGHTQTCVHTHAYRHICMNRHAHRHTPLTHLPSPVFCLSVDTTLLSYFSPNTFSFPVLFFLVSCFPQPTPISFPSLTIMVQALTTPSLDSHGYLLYHMLFPFKSILQQKPNENSDGIAYTEGKRSLQNHTRMCPIMQQYHFQELT